MSSATAPEFELAALSGKAARIATIIFAISVVASVATIGAILFIAMPKALVGTLVVVLSILLMMVGMNVGMAMLAAALLGLYALSGTRVMISTIRTVSFESAASWSYSVIPMFILMGMILWKSGLTASAFEAARRWLGWMPGGLAVATNFAGAGLSASSGTTIGIAYALGNVSIPEMLKSGYKPELAVGAVAAAGTLGQIIPPSLLLVIYAGAASLPVGPTLLAGIVPGVLLAIAYAALIVIHVMVRPSLAPRLDNSGITWAMRWQSVIDTLPVGIVVLVVIGGMFAGIFTATESGVFGMLAALFLGIHHMLRSGRSLRDVFTMMRESLVGTLLGVASVFVLIIGVQVLTRAMALSQLPNEVVQLIVDLDLSRVELLLILVVVYFILGTAIDSLAMMLLTIPVLLGPLTAMGVDPLWFGVFLVIMAEIGQLTPPLGILLFVVHRIASDPAANLGKPISLNTVFIGVTPFALVAIVFTILLIAFPEIVTWLPNASYAQ
jgi:tripartite ATP-independent transporter DctM subunit